MSQPARKRQRVALSSIPELYAVVDQYFTRIEEEYAKECDDRDERVRWLNARVERFKAELDAITLRRRVVAEHEQAAAVAAIRLDVEDEEGAEDDQDEENEDDEDEDDEDEDDEEEDEEDEEEEEEEEEDDDLSNTDPEELHRELRRVSNKIEWQQKARLERIWSRESDEGDYPEFCALDIEKQLLSLYRQALNLLKYVPPRHGSWADCERDYERRARRLEMHVRRGVTDAKSGARQRLVPPETAQALG